MCSALNAYFVLSTLLSRTLPYITAPHAAPRTRLVSPLPVPFNCMSKEAIVNIDPTLIPSHLRTHIIPSIRRLYLDEPNPNIDSSMDTPKAVSECARISAENTALRHNCGLWRRRAEVHAAATLGLLNVARIARDSAVQMKQEKDELERRYNVLKRKIDAEECVAFPFHPIHC